VINDHLVELNNVYFLIFSFGMFFILKKKILLRGQQFNVG